jgi:hypothetical protein
LCSIASIERPGADHGAVGVRQREQRRRANVRQIAVHAAHGAKIVQQTPDERLAEEGREALPERVVLRDEVQNDHAVVGDARQIRLDHGRQPEALVRVEEPALHQPHGALVRLGHRVDHRRRRLAQVGSGRCSPASFR